MEGNVKKYFVIQSFNQKTESICTQKYTSPGSPYQVVLRFVEDRNLPKNSQQPIFTPTLFSLIIPNNLHFTFESPQGNHTYTHRIRAHRAHLSPCVLPSGPWTVSLSRVQRSFPFLNWFSYSLQKSFKKTTNYSWHFSAL